MATKTKPNEIHLTRVYDAPLAAVWDAWTDPAQAAQWWGPRGFTITTHGKDFRPGGYWAYTMHGPDGTDYPNKTQYLEIEDKAKLVYDHGANDDQPPKFRVTVLFSETKGRTMMDMTMALATAEAAAETREFIKKAGGNGTWDRLGEFVHKQATGKESFVIARSFEVPLDRMYQMWTDPKHFSQWLPPTGFTMRSIRADIRPGGSSFYEMTSADGKMKMFGRCDYREMQSPDRVVYTQQFCDEHEHVTRHPMAATWPETNLTTVTLAAEGQDQTRVTIQWEPYGKVTPVELETFVQARGGMTQGWGGSFDKLEAYVAMQNA